MAVAHDAASESHTGTTGSVSEASYSWSHTPAGTPAGALVFTFFSGSLSDSHATAVTYGSESLTAVVGGAARDTLNEPGGCKAWFLGTGIPTGAQTVVVTRPNDAVAHYAIAITVTATGDTAISGTPVLLEENDTWAEQNVDSGVDTALRYAGAFAGQSADLPAGANSTQLHILNDGARSRSAVRENTAGSGSRPIGWTSATSDDRAAVHLAIAESGGGGGGAVTRSFAVIVS